MATAVVAAPDFYAISGLFHKFTARTPTEKISPGNQVEQPVTFLKLKPPHQYYGLP